MAITYKSQGAGVSTETSGAALSPLCPATVDAGDILIAHVFWESNVTAPSTPSGWTLLDGPRLIETSVARHWVFGKIAAGTEDGSAVAFGSPAVTTQRAARIYSFAGRVGGTITELVTGFAATSHATDPQMPSVTTTLAGALAVALVAQNDNNAFASPTGESGGDWVEAVAEYTVALTPGFSLGIEIATPTANPGTISGGSMATTNDPCGVIGFQILPSAPPVNLVVADVSHSNAIDSIVLSQEHNLTASDIQHNHALDNVVLEAGVDLVVQDAAHAHALESFTLTQDHFLVIQDALHSTSLDALTFTQNHTLVITDMGHTQSVEELTLTQEYNLVIQDATHAHFTDGDFMSEDHQCCGYIVMRHSQRFRVGRRSRR